MPTLPQRPHRGQDLARGAATERTFFTVQCLAAIRLADDLSPTDRLVLYTLAGHANAGGLAWPSVPTIMRETGLSRRGVYNALGALERAGVLVRRHPSTHAGTVYDLGGLVARVAGVPGVHPRVHRVHETGAPRAQTGAPDAPKEDLKKKLKKRAPPGAPPRATRLRPEDQPPEAVAAFLAALSPVAPTPPDEGRHEAPRPRARVLRGVPGGRAGRTPSSE